MSDPAKKKKDNVPGKVYVDENCVDCDLCRQAAPKNFTRNDTDGYSYVYKQPENAEEEESCRAALSECPVQAIGNDGNGGN